MAIYENLSDTLCETIVNCQISLFFEILCFFLGKLLFNYLSFRFFQKFKGDRRNSSCSNVVALLHCYSDRDQCQSAGISISIFLFICLSLSLYFFFCLFLTVRFSDLTAFFMTRTHLFHFILTDTE